jgi:glycosyltransferase involved in cell wall biosynthesis
MLEHKSRRLVQVSASLDPRLGGPHRVVSDTSEILTRYFDFQNIVFGEAKNRGKNMIIENTTMNNRYGFLTKIPSSRARRALNDADVLLLHGYYLYSTLIGLLYSRTSNIYVMPHGSLENYQEHIGQLRKILFRLVARLLLRGRHITFMVASHSELNSAQNVFPNSRIEVVGLGINFSNNVPEELALPRDPVILYTMSRIAPIKRIDLCIRAIAELNVNEVKYHLEVIGTGEKHLEESLRQLVLSLNLSDSVTFRGFLDGKAKNLASQSADIFLLTSENENFALGVAEAISAFKPVIVSKFVAMHEFVDEHEVGITLSTLESAELAQAIEKVVENYATYQLNCLKSRSLLNWEFVIKSWIRVLTSDEKSK